MLLICLLAFALLASPARAVLTIEITGGAATQIPIAVVPFSGGALQPQSLTGIVSADLQHSGQFKLVDSAGVVPQPHAPADVRYADWTGLGADALVIGSISALPGGRLDVKFRLLDVSTQSQLAGFSYTITPAQLRTTAHKIADVVYQTLTGIPGVFNTRIAYVVKRDARFDLQVADMDGYGAQTIVRSRQPIISPAWSPDGTRLAYVSFEKGRAAIYVQSLATGQRRVLADFKGSNSAPAWSPDGSKLAIVLTRGGNSQLYLIDADGSHLQRLSHSSAIDTEPDWSPDGKQIIFTSDRGGSPQIYLMPSTGGAAQRLTFEGDYNVSPHFSPDGKSFVFIHRSDGKFNVAVQDIATGQMQVLSDGSMDESPSFAPNGKMILYTTEVGGRDILAAVSSDGGTKQRLYVQSGDMREPAWGPLVKN